MHWITKKKCVCNNVKTDSTAWQLLVTRSCKLTNLFSQNFVRVDGLSWDRRNLSHLSTCRSLQSTCFAKANNCKGINHYIIYFQSTAMDILYKRSNFTRAKQNSNIRITFNPIALFKIHTHNVQLFSNYSNYFPKAVTIEN